MRTWAELLSDVLFTVLQLTTHSRISRRGFGMLSVISWRGVVPG